MWKDKLSSYILDVSKYLLTGVVVASLFKDYGEDKLFLYGWGIAAAFTFLVLGLYLSSNSKPENTHKKSFTKNHKHK